MPTVEIFDSYPPFPKDVPSAVLPCLSYNELLQGSNKESLALFQACRTDGFFLLDLQGSSEGEALLKCAQRVFDLSKVILELDQETLMKYHFKPPTNLCGYKPVGQMKLQDGSPDAIDFYALGQDDLFAKPTLKTCPQPIVSNYELFYDFFNQSHQTVCHILSHLDQHLDLSLGTLASFISQDKPSGTIIRMLRCLPQRLGTHRTNLTGHTDMGCVTLLFNIVGGLQILPSGSDNAEENWRYVQPRPGCVLVNLGDAMVQWSGGILRSNLHRVATPPGRQAECERFSLAYLTRPESSASMQRLESGSVIPRLANGEEKETLNVKDWESSRAALYMVGKMVPQSTGGILNGVH
ncbi:hypothetical protein MMC26_002436 [Xylographa opegraphella]|nr:hypothetical protein [Xylographa opegraphella]